MLTKNSWLQASVTAGAALVLAMASPLRAELSLEERNEHLASIAAESRGIQADASEVELALRAKKPDFAAVREMLGEISHAIDGLESSVLKLESASPAWAAATDSYQAMKNKAALLRTFATNKGALLDSPEALKNRRILAAKAKGIADRARLLSEAAGHQAE